MMVEFDLSDKIFDEDKYKGGLINGLNVKEFIKRLKKNENLC